MEKFNIDYSTKNILKPSERGIYDTANLESAKIYRTNEMESFLVPR